MHPGIPLSRSQLDEDVTDLAMYRYDAQGPSTFDGYSRPVRYSLLAIFFVRVTSRLLLL